MRLLPVAITLALCCLALPAKAASGETLPAQSGSVINVQITNQQAAALSELGLLRQTLTPYQADAAESLNGGLFTTKLSRTLSDLRARLLDRRQTCHTTLRRTSVLNRWTTLASCYSDDLAAHRVILTTVAAAVDDLQGVSAGARQQVSTKLLQLLDAEQALIEGIDGKVFEDEAQLLSSKKRLTEKYAQPLRLSLTQLRADRSLHWIARLAADLETTVSEWTPDDARLATAHDHVSCLSGAVASLLNVPAGTTPSAGSEALNQGLDGLQNCADGLLKWLDPPALPEPQKS